MTEITVQCCEGNDPHGRRCIQWRCPIYGEVQASMDRSWPYVGTGFGNLYGNLDHKDYLLGVKKHLSKKRETDRKN